KYLVDVGFGEFAFEPLLMVHDGPQQDERGRFCVKLDDNNHYCVSKVQHGKKKYQYLFEDKACVLGDFEEMCLYHQTSPDSKFTQRKLITLPILNGRYTLTSDKFIYKVANRIKIDTIDSITEYNEKLKEFFG